MSFILYDVTFLILFLIFISFFLYRGKKNLKKEGLLLLYKTSWGIKLINYVGKKYKKTLKFLSYVSISIGYILMVTMIYLFGKVVWIYFFSKDIVQQIKVPPIMPLFPYLPQVLKLDWLPPFYFTYWIIILAIIAITHEFAHGIFASREKVKIKKTGFGFFPFFLPIFLAAFVELDEKILAKKKKFAQMAVISAGTFANVLTAILFMGILTLFFTFAFTPTGVIVDQYAYYLVAVPTITSVNGISLENPTYENIVNLLENSSFNDVEAGGEKFVAIGGYDESTNTLALYPPAPAINSRLERIIFKVNNIEVTNREMLIQELSKYSPGETVTFNVLASDDKDYDKDIILEARPDNPDVAWLGIVFLKNEPKGIIGNIVYKLSSFKNPTTYYVPKIDGLTIFIYQLLWWIVIISISVALLNMLPVGIFDGGRFFYLTVLVLTKSEKKAKKSFVFMTRLIGYLVLAIMVLWAYKLFLL